LETVFSTQPSAVEPFWKPFSALNRQRLNQRDENQKKKQESEPSCHLVIPTQLRA
jgi:hypothetical protein